MSARASVSETPVKPIQSIRLQPMEPQKAAVTAAVENDLRGHLHAASLHSFLHNIFPMKDEDINAIYRLVSAAGMKGGYDKKLKCWKNFPTSSAAQEKEYYEPVAAAANAIREAATSLISSRSRITVNVGDGVMNDVEGRESGDVGNGNIGRRADPEAQNSEVTNDSPIDGVWLDRHSKTPEGVNVATASIRPDLIFVSLPQAVKELDEKIGPDEVLEPAKELPTFRGSGRIKKQGKVTQKDGQNDTETKNASPDKDVLLKVWWQQIHTPLEIKRKGQKPRDALLQLFTYMRTMLQEQVDRRFALGLLLCFDKLTVCMCDRSGAVFTNSPFSIHEYPMRFIRVIAAFSMLKPYQLGWDPSMKVFLPDENRAVCSYNLDSRTVRKDLYETHWLIDLVTQNGPPEQVLTVRGISLARAEVMCGRATVVWEVVKYAEWRNPQNLYILKRYWRPTELPSSQSLSYSATVQTGDITVDNFAPERLVPEEEFYEELGVSDERLVFSGDAVIDGAVDSTQDFIRAGLFLTPASWEDFEVETEPTTQEATGSKRKHTAFSGTDETAEANLPCKTTGIVPLRTPSVNVIPRIRTQLLMQDPGPSVRHFCCLMELVSVMNDCIQDHKDFNGKGVLHRDVSPGNMVIVPKERSLLDWKKTKGRLIDFDHAKQTSYRKLTNLAPSAPVEERLVSKTLVAMDDDLIDRVGDDVIAAGLKALGTNYRPQVQMYVERTVKVRESYFGLKPPASGRYSCADLGWNRQDREIPNFEDRQARLGFRSGTRPYMSYEVLATQVHHKYYNLPLEFFHDSVHDMDSFNWVLIHICLTRKGPGLNQLRDELALEKYINGKDPYVVALNKCINRFFDGDEPTLLRERSNLLAEPEIMDKDILPYFHEYFHPLRPLISRWWHTLVLAYHYRAFEYYHTHDFFLEILQLTIDEYKGDSSFNGTDGNEGTEREIQRRIERYDPKRIRFGGPRGVHSENSIAMIPKKDVQSTVAPEQIPLPDSPTPVNTSRSRKKRRTKDAQPTAAPAARPLPDSPTPVNTSRSRRKRRAKAPSH
ncbi:hypothetical protein Hypma_002857 [Hypsizygus marmoreus]|uniref:Fungal-type protein kinase domain-containing protein n=1 Tax=Hypsizygus marmoreus TaxID=39966 RepID=A0A369J513_HYPMA|nr:hypothetical protein Hypma_002857 [Hypsizygus marmoreus]